MTPRWLVYQLRAEQWDLNLLDRSVEAVETALGDPALVDWDTRISGRPREPELAIVVDKCAAQPLWIRRGRETVGYGFVQQRTVDELG